LGELPELLNEKIPAEVNSRLADSLDKIEASVNRLGPTEVVDRCRDALSVAFGAVCEDASQDLGAAINSYVSKISDKKDTLSSHAGRIVARLHSRGKPNEQDGRDLRAPTDDDARLAVKCVCGWFWSNSGGRSSKEGSLRNGEVEGDGFPHSCPLRLLLSCDGSSDIVPCSEP
jgi:hypothetical protein